MISNYLIQRFIYPYLQIAIWTESSDINHGIIVLQHSLKELEIWSKKWGFKFSINKTKAMIFSHKKFENNINLKINNHDIEFVNQFKFLGLIFDNRFTWNEHVNYIEAVIKVLIY